jgi:hypothetical protein
MMSRVAKGVTAGLVATVAVSVLEAVNVFALKWFTPFPNVIANTLGLEGNPAAAWAIHLISGTVVLGALFGILCPRLPTDTPETKGILFAVGAWVAMMLVIMFVGDSGVLGGNFATVAWMLVTHAVYGIVLGNVYARLIAREKRAALMVDGVPA